MSTMKYKLSPLLEKYDTIVFDLDGVITSEQRYWDAAAMTLYQLFTEEFDVNYANRNVSITRTVMLYRDQLISLCKELGVNSNWDLTYVIYAFSQILDTLDTASIYFAIKELNLPALELYDYIEKNSFVGGRNSDAYKYIIKVYQEWYHGENNYHKYYNDDVTAPGKISLCDLEEPLLDRAKTIEMIKLLSNTKTLGVATGRIKFEAERPLENWDVLQYFSPKHIATYDDVIAAEKETGIKPITKPHPFMFLRGGLGSDVSYTDILNGNYDKNKLKSVLAIGDAGADMFSAQNAGIDFAAVLTGINGKKAQQFFEQNNATYIFNNVFDLIEEE